MEITRAATEIDKPISKNANPGWEAKLLKAQGKLPAKTIIVAATDIRMGKTLKMSDANKENYLPLPLKEDTSKLLKVNELLARCAAPSNKSAQSKSIPLQTEA